MLGLEPSIFLQLRLAAPVFHRRGVSLRGAVSACRFKADAFEQRQAQPSLARTGHTPARRKQISGCTETPLCTGNFGARIRATAPRRVSIGATAGSCKSVECLRVAAEGVASLDFSGEPPVAKVLPRAPPAPVAHLFHDGLDSRVIGRSSPGVQADTHHHAHQALGRGSRQASLKPH